MNVREQHVPNVSRIHPFGLQAIEKVGHRKRGARVYERTFTVVDDEMAGVELRPSEGRVDGGNAVCKVR